METSRSSSEARQNLFLFASWFQSILRDDAKLGQACLEAARAEKLAAQSAETESPATAALAFAQGRYEECVALSGQAIDLVARQASSRSQTAYGARLKRLRERASGRLGPDEIAGGPGQDESRD